MFRTANMRRLSSYPSPFTELSSEVRMPRTPLGTLPRRGMQHIVVIEAGRNSVLPRRLGFCIPPLAALLLVIDHFNIDWSSRL